MSTKERSFDIRVRADGVDVTLRKTFLDDEGELERAITDVLDAARRQVSDRRLRQLHVDVDEVI